MTAHQATYSIASMCAALDVSASGYYAWRQRRPSARATRDRALRRRITTIHRATRGVYGTPRIHAELAEAGICIGRKRVARLLRAAGLRGVTRRKFVVTTRRSADSRPAPDLVRRDFTARGPDQLWVADITYVRTQRGFVYLAVVLDVWSRRIVGWAIKPTLDTELVLAALAIAIRTRQPQAVIHHSDQGCQYTSYAFGHRCREAGVRPSMGTVGCAYDNAMCESFFATLECELLGRHRFTTADVARREIFEFIEGFYNTRRRHSALGYLSPSRFERQHAMEAAGGRGRQDRVHHRLGKRTERVSHSSHSDH